MRAAFGSAWIRVERGGFGILNFVYTRPGPPASDAEFHSCGPATTSYGRRFTVAPIDFVGSATLVAVTVTLVLALAGEGAVYNPDVLIDPGPLIDHVTAVFGS